MIENPPTKSGKCKRHGFIPWVRKIPWGKMTTYSSTVHGVTESDTTDHRTLYILLHTYVYKSRGLKRYPIF